MTASSDSTADANRAHGADANRAHESGDDRSPVRVLVTRSRRGPGRLRQKLEAAGFAVVSVPTIEFREIEHPSWEQTLCPDDRTGWDWIVLTSRTTVEFFAERWGEEGVRRRFEGFGKVVAVGRSTAEKLESLGISVSIVPARFDAEGLVDALDGAVKPGDRVVIPRAREARMVLPEALDAWGAAVTLAPVYETLQPAKTTEWLAAIAPGDVDVLTFASSKTVEHFVELLPDAAHWLKAVPCACIGPITQEYARRQGFTVMELPEEATFDSLVEHLVRWRDAR